MEFRSALPVAVLIGSMIGVAVAGTSPRNAKFNSHGFSVSSLVDGAGDASSESGATWDIPVVRNSAVQRFVDIFTLKQQDRMALYLKRSGRYEGMIRGKLREKGMPEDLVYLSMIESGFNPTARSKAQAVGLWQFMEGTGERYGLRIDGYVDERRDPEKSTDAALRYLRDLYRQFGSWYLAAAAYNTGEHRVSRVMREMTGSEKGAESDFWRIRRRLPAETREYVPLMLAAALIGKEPHKYGLGDVERYLPVPTDSVEVPGGIDLALVARSVGVAEKDIRALNPQLVRGITPPGKKGYVVRVPEGRATQFAASFEGVREEARAEAAAAEAKARIERAERARIARARNQAKRAKHGVSSTRRSARKATVHTAKRRSGSSAKAHKRASRPVHHRSSRRRHR